MWMGGGVRADACVCGSVRAGMCGGGVHVENVCLHVDVKRVCMSVRVCV